MTFLDLARRRYSVRSYRPDPVPDDLLATVLEAGRLAPTAANRQPIRILVVHTAGREAELRRIYDRDWFVAAPLVLCVCAVPGEAWRRTMYDGRSHADVDATIVMDHLVLAAADLGLGHLLDRRVRPGCGARGPRHPTRRASRCCSRRSASRRPTRLPRPATQERRPLDEIVRHERW